MTEPKWLQKARSDVGVREIPGSLTAPRIAGWLAKLKAWWKDDETPWCGAAVAGWMLEADVTVPQHWYRAKGWLDWGQPMDVPAPGCVVVFSRTGGGHVGLVVAEDGHGRLLVLGGNQGNAVNIAPFDRSRVVGYRWPSEHPLPLEGLPVVLSHAASSLNEA